MHLNENIVLTDSYINSMHEFIYEKWPLVLLVIDIIHYANLNMKI